MKKHSKYFLGLGAMVTLAAPVAAVISCSCSQNSKETTLQTVVREYKAAHTKADNLVPKDAPTDATLLAEVLAESGLSAKPETIATQAQTNQQLKDAMDLLATIDQMKETDEAKIKAATALINQHIQEIEKWNTAVDRANAPVSISNPFASSYAIDAPATAPTDLAGLNTLFGTNVTLPSTTTLKSVALNGDKLTIVLTKRGTDQSFDIALTGAAPVVQNTPQANTPAQENHAAEEAYKAQLAITQAITLQDVAAGKQLSLADEHLTKPAAAPAEVTGTHTDAEWNAATTELTTWNAAAKTWNDAVGRAVDEVEYAWQKMIAPGLKYVSVPNNGYQPTFGQSINMQQFFTSAVAYNGNVWNKQNFLPASITAAQGTAIKAWFHASVKLTSYTTDAQKLQWDRVLKNHTQFDAWVDAVVAKLAFALDANGAPVTAANAGGAKSIASTMELFQFLTRAIYDQDFEMGLTTDYNTYKTHKEAFDARSSVVDKWIEILKANPESGIAAPIVMTSRNDNVDGFTTRIETIDDAVTNLPAGMTVTAATLTTPTDRYHITHETAYTPADKNLFPDTEQFIQVIFPNAKVRLFKQADYDNGNAKAYFISNFAANKQ